MNRFIAPRQSTSNCLLHNLLKTTLQIILFWGFFLLLVPSVILRVEVLTGFEKYRLHLTWLPPIGILLFSVMAAIGLYCATLFVRFGSGTPLPLDSTTRFIVLGPYRYVRNPMAITGLTQGFAVGLIAQSPIVMLYAILGGFVWNYVARGYEERDLEARFGETFVAYRNSVRCWIPKLKPYPKQP